MNGDRITLTGLRAFGHHGVFDDERANGQEFVLDVTIFVDFAAAAAGDDLNATVHYGVVAEEIVAAVERDPVDLIETLAERVAAVVLGARGGIRGAGDDPQAARADHRAVRRRRRDHHPGPTLTQDH